MLASRANQHGSMTWQHDSDDADRVAARERAGVGRAREDA